MWNNLLCLLTFSIALVNAQVNQSWPYQTFKTQPSFQPPKLQITRSGTPAPGYLFFAPAGAAHQVAPLITTNDGELVYQGQTGNVAFAWGSQIYRGKPVLAYLNGTLYPEPVGRGYGKAYLVGNTYSSIANVSLAGDFVTTEGPTYASNVDIHELFITNRNTVLVTANNATQADLTSVGGPKDGWVVDGQVYEIDIATNKVLFSWSALNHTDQIPFTASAYPLGSEGFNGQNKSAAWGYFHVNAVAPLNDGYIISSRYTCSLIAVSKTGAVDWRISGRNGADFDLAPSANFCFQHDVRPVYANPHTYSVGRNFTLHIHDNANSPIDNGTTPSSGLLLRVDQDAKTVSDVARYANPADPIYSDAQGSYQTLPNGNVFIGHGYTPYIEEFAANGSIIETTRFGAAPPTLSYRAFKQDWVGCPKTKPAVYVDQWVNDAVNMTVYVSWNGATEVDGWTVSGGAVNGNLELVEKAKKQGFETAIDVPRTPRVQVQAVLKGGGCSYSHKETLSEIVVVE